MYRRPKLVAHCRSGHCEREWHVFPETSLVNFLVEAVLGTIDCFPKTFFTPPVWLKLFEDSE